MRAILLVVALAAAGSTARRFLFTDPDIPIILVKTSFGVGHRTRIHRLEATIHVRHLTDKKKVDFKTSGPLERHYRGIRARGDERGHLVGAQFSGPPKWFNLSPQYVRVNRNLGYQAITKAWFKAECKVREFLEGGGNRVVFWTVNMKYPGYSNRPKSYRLRVAFSENNRLLQQNFNYFINNPLTHKNSSFWICQDCNWSYRPNCSRAH